MFYTRIWGDGPPSVEALHRAIDDIGSIETNMSSYGSVWFGGYRIITSAHHNCVSVAHESEEALRELLLMAEILLPACSSWFELFKNTAIAVGE